MTRLLIVMLVALIGCDDARYGSGTASETEDLGGDVADDIDDVVERDASPDAPGDTPDLSPAPDAGRLEGTCDIKLETADAAGSCSIDVRSMVACDEFARCVCEIVALDDAERCIASLVIPRGAITLADYCVLPGAEGAVPLASVVEGEMGPWDMRGADWALEASDDCDRVAAFSMMGAEPSWNLSWEPDATEVPSLPASLEDLDRDPVPLLTLADVESYEAATATFKASGGRLGDVSTNVAPRPAVFIAHTDEAPLWIGVFWSEVMSSLPPDNAPVILYEQLAADGNAAVQVVEYPSRAPARPGPGYDSSLAAQFAAERKQLDPHCISSCGCPLGRACVEGICAAMDGCTRDSDCCLGACSGGVCR